ncbi:Hypothetical protein NTJ_02543 [Nesidiocoris tenuis]|uniref:Uncharacterized protein n=1 Tax=Nesidiocoris tenuis TaxID=355587 RepID=A0ABN7ABP1_9HEMI|nr:Hypothetical protein NTJ_02543 [Nesidiocoris tenuis]
MCMQAPSTPDSARGAEYISCEYTVCVVRTRDLPPFHCRVRGASGGGQALQSLARLLSAGKVATAALRSRSNIKSCASHTADVMRCLSWATLVSQI